MYVSCFFSRNHTQRYISISNYNLLYMKMNNNIYVQIFEERYNQGQLLNGNSEKDKRILSIT